MANRKLAKGGRMLGRASADEIIDELNGMANPRNVAGMARFGIKPENALGISMTSLKPLAKRIGKDHGLSLALWKTGVREARILASLVDEPDNVTEEQMERWAGDFDSWDICDGCCLHLFCDTAHAWAKAVEWSKRGGEYVKRAGYALMAVLAVHDKNAEDAQFIKLLPLIKKGSTDERNYVRKAVNWALRQIGKRNQALNAAAVKTAKEILALDTKSSRWIARDALRELRGGNVQVLLAEKANRIRDETAPKSSQRLPAKSRSRARRT
jgi:3-methyladenine DNA glycosylase AlkD